MQRKAQRCLSGTIKADGCSVFFLYFFFPFFFAFNQPATEVFFFLSSTSPLRYMFYVLTFILIISLILFRRIDIANLFLVAVSIYGLCLYHYYVYRTGGLSYRSLTVPFVIIVSLTLHNLLLRLPPATSKRILIWLP